MQVTFGTSTSGMIAATLKGGSRELLANGATVESALHNLAFEVKQSGLEMELAAQVKQ